MLTALRRRRRAPTHGQAKGRDQGECRRGQALVELAIILPLLLFMALGVFDFARAFTTAIAVESAAREAADFGALYRWHWRDAASVSATEANMEGRACSAASTLTDYVGDPPSDAADCTNPAFSYELIESPWMTANPGTTCYDVPREQSPCLVEVTLEYEFNVIVPLGLSLGDTRLGFPDQLTIERSSTFAVSDFEVDTEPSP